MLDVIVGTGTTTYELTSLRVDTIPQGPNGLGGVDGNTTTPVIGGTYYDLDVTSPGLYTGADAAAPFEFTVSVPEPGAPMIIICAGFVLGIGPWRRFGTQRGALHA